jgi:hypothetical protein
MREFNQSSADRRRELVMSKGEDFWYRTFSLYEKARFARLTRFLLQREPDDEVNYSILIYRLQASDLARALDGPPVELDDAAPSSKKSMENLDQN